MNEPKPGEANVLWLDVLAESDGNPITTGTVAFYLMATSGANAGKWWDGSGGTWSAVKAAAATVTHATGHADNGQWYATIAAGAWTDGVRYRLYAVESGDLNIVAAENMICRDIEGQLDIIQAKTDLIGTAEAAVLGTGEDTTTVLEAVNEMLTAIGEWPVAALDTNGTSIEAKAEEILYRANRRVQAKGWHCNLESEREYTPADATKVACVISGDGAWTAAAKTLVKTDAFASYTWAAGDQIYVSGGTGLTAGWYEIASKTDDDTIVLWDSLLATDVADVTTTLIGWDDAVVLGSDVLRADSDGASARRDVCIRNGMLYDRDEKSFTMPDATITLSLVRLLAFSHLIEEMRAYVVAVASRWLNRDWPAATAADNKLAKAEESALIDARRADSFGRDPNVLAGTDTARSLGISGYGYAYR